LTFVEKGKDRAVCVTFPLAPSVENIALKLSCFVFI
jgi:hypothetical protein